MNDDVARPVLWTCAGALHAPEIFEPGVQTVSCANWGVKQTRSITVSKDGHVIRDRREYVSNLTHKRVRDDSWAETTMTYKGECPVPLKDAQLFVVIKPEGKAFDPFQSTACMVDVLKTVAGVTGPKAGYFWEPGGGPLPFVQYTYPSRYDLRPTDITFTADAALPYDDKKMHFGVELSGISSSRAEGPDNYDAENIIPLWKARCGVEADISYP
jgi:hypothetical protein